MGNSGFFRVWGIAFVLAGAASALVSLVPSVRSAVGCSGNDVCDPVVRSAGGIVARTFLMIGVIWVAVSFLGSAGRKRAERLRQAGAAVPGEVLEVLPTGLVIHGRPRVAVTVRVDAPAGAFIVRGRVLSFGLAVGSRVRVHYDAADPGDFTISPLEAPAAGPARRAP